MSDHPIENLMASAMTNIKQMIDVDTIIGKPINSENGITIIPISKVTFGFAAGGSEFKSEAVNEYSKIEDEESILYRLPFGGGSGAGANIQPVAFLIVQNDNVKLMPIEYCSTIDKIADCVPDIINKINDFINKKEDKKQETTINYTFTEENKE